MKKTISILLVILILFPCFSLADLPDISELSVEELIELNHQIQFRLFSENLINGVEVPSGVYIVGEDIPEGTYRLEVLFPKAGGYLTVYESKESNKSIVSSFLGEYWGVTAIGKIELTNGNVVDISTSLRFFAYTGLFN